MPKKRNPTCPNCGKEMKLVVYGLPVGPPSENDNWVIGGCVVTDLNDKPEYVCVFCDEDNDDVQDLIDLR